MAAKTPRTILMKAMTSWTVVLLLLAGGAASDFSDQCPKACTCKWANGKREADCTNAGFTTVPTNLHHEIQILRMSGNYVRKLGKDVFRAANLLNLQRIFMNNCHVQEIHEDAFRDLKIMVELDLSHNNLTGLEPRTFTGNERLQTLTLSHNQLAELDDFQFPPLKHLKTIDVAHNAIAEIQTKAFMNLGNSVEAVYINNNQMRSLREEIFLPLTNLKSLQLHSNPWMCDCKLKNFRDWVVDRGLYTYPTSCVEPERLADKLWEHVDGSEFACKPEIRVPQSVVFSSPGANVTLSCFIVGSPMPEAKWVLKGRIVNNNTSPTGANPEQSQLFLIHEEGGLERWFNLTVTNVGPEAVADYTCVAVNAGGVMEENISLTFEEPEPVGLPGGKKEESNLAIIIGAAAGGFLFVVVLLLLLCCCCCRRRTKQHSNPSSSSRTPERHGSLIGFTDSNSSQKLIPTAVGSPHKEYNEIEQPRYDLELHDLSTKRNIMVTSNNSSNGTSYHTTPTDQEHFPPDLLNFKTSPNKSQPLNPAALVVPAPPHQFPHQFPHLIHSSSQNGGRSGTLPHPPRSLSCDNTTSGGVVRSLDATPTLISPPPQFTSSKQQPSSTPCYVTLPRRAHQRPDHHDPKYDGVGPRTSATGASVDMPPPPLQFVGLPCPTIPEEGCRRSTRRRSSSTLRDSSGSEVTLGEDGIQGYCEPFGKAFMAKKGGVRDSIASTESDMESMLGMKTSRNPGPVCPLHKPRQEVKLKGILKKESSFSSSSSSPHSKPHSVDPSFISPQRTSLPPAKPQPPPRIKDVPEVLNV